MMRRLGVIAGLCLCAAAAAQANETLTVPEITTQVISPVESVGPGPPEGQYLITNKADVAIVAMHFTYGCRDLKTDQIFDVLVSYGLERPIGYQQTWTSIFASPEILNCPGGVDAAVFADGHTEGERQMLAEIYRERRGVYDGISFVLPLLDKVVKSRRQKEEALQAISNELTEIQSRISNDAPTLTGETFVFRIISDSLQKEIPMGIPSDMRPSQQAIRNVMETEHLSHTSAAAYLIRQRLLVWQRDLQGHLGADTEEAR